MDNPVQTFITEAIKTGTPSIIELSFIGGGKVDWNLNGIWTRDPVIKVTPPYAAYHPDAVNYDVNSTWGYAMELVGKMEPVPYENMEESGLDAAKALLKKLKQSVVENPYTSLHTFSEGGITISAQLMFTP